MKKTIVNPTNIVTIFEPLCSYYDGIDEAYGIIDSNDENAVKEIIRKIIIPDNLCELPKSQAKTKFALQYALSLPPDRVQWKYMFELSPFCPPNEARLLFVWVWEEWFPGEDYHIDIYNDVDVRDNPDMLKRYGLDLPPK